jgi:hypothetical protein
VSGGPVEVRLTQPHLSIKCEIVHDDGTTTEPPVWALKMRGAQREMTSRLAEMGYEPAGRWQYEADEDAGPVGGGSHRMFRRAAAEVVGPPVDADATVVVRRQWDNTQRARYNVADLKGLHLSQDQGTASTFYRRAPHVFVTGYVMCDEAVSGELPHSCTHGPPPHRIKVCVIAKDNTPAVMTALRARAAVAASRFRLPAPS